MDRDVSPHRTVAIVGAGAGGTFVAVQLLRLARAPLSIALLDEGGRFGRGVAYSTTSPLHVLNVPAGGMSALPDDADHFLRWARGPGNGGSRAPDAGPGDFLPRALYGEYVASVLEQAEREAAPGVTLRRIGAEAVAARPARDRVEIRLADGTALEASHAVIAVGNLPPAPLGAPGLASLDPSRFAPDPWAKGALEALVTTGSVLLLGTGLTMVDVALVLAERGAASLLAVSRRGLLPQPHVVPSPAAVSPVAEGETLGLLRLVRRVRETADSQRGGDSGGWRAVVDGLRPHSQRLWQGFSEDDRRRFVRHVRAHWGSVRHRIAPSVARRIEALLRSGALRARAGRLVRVEAVPAGVRARLRIRGSGRDEELLASAIVSCTGPKESYLGAGSRLVDDLLESGAVRPGPAGIGLDASPEGMLIGADGVPSSVLSTLGPARKGALWETTAVPEMRDQARDLARAILAS